MSTPDSDSFQHGHDQRKRVGKACDRCRLKKSKCDGVSPCLRCSQDNAICEFGERKKIIDRAFPKGYVEMIEQQQESITKGIRLMYKSLLTNGLWEGEPLSERNGQPLTHDILERLGALRSVSDKSTPKFIDNLEEERRLMEVRQRQQSEDSMASIDEKTIHSVIGDDDSDCGSSASPSLSMSSISSRKRTPVTPPSDHNLPASRPHKKRPASINTKLPPAQQLSSPISRDSPIVASSPVPYDVYSFQPQTAAPMISPAFFLQSASDSSVFSAASIMSHTPYTISPYNFSSNTTLAVDAFQDAQQGLMPIGSTQDYPSIDSPFAPWT